MREIKFRGLVESQNEGMDNTPTDKWVYGSLVIEPDRSIIQWTEGNIAKGEIVVAKSVGQYTGLRDSHGVEIYEGDIVTHYHNGQEHYIPNSFVEWKMGSLCFVWSDNWHAISHFHADGIDSYKVIGNIYENPELLEK